MSSSISWTDSTGAASLTNTLQSPGDRFSDWVVQRKPVGPITTGLGTGEPDRVRFRLDQTVSFHLSAIPEDQMPLMVRLQYHLLNGGSVSLTGDRAMASTFADCSIAPDTEPEISAADPQQREYTFSCVLRTHASGEDLDVDDTIIVLDTPPDSFASRPRFPYDPMGDPTAEPSCFSASNVDATFETDEPHEGWLEGTLWFEFISPYTGKIVVHTHKSDPTLDTVIFVYSGTDLATLTYIGFNDDDGVIGSLSGYTFNAVEGVTYQIQAGVNIGTPRGNIVVCWEYPPPDAHWTSINTDELFHEFDASASTYAPGSTFHWTFNGVTVDTDDPLISHQFSEPAGILQVDPDGFHIIGFPHVTVSLTIEDPYGRTDTLSSTLFKLWDSGLSLAELMITQDVVDHGDPFYEPDGRADNRYFGPGPAPAITPPYYESIGYAPYATLTSTGFLFDGAYTVTFHYIDFGNDHVVTGGFTYP